MDRLNAMRTFIRVIECGSFSKAALQLRVGQPAISKAIASLESRLGVRLLLRSTHGVTATTAGRNFYEHARRAVWEADKADLAARGAGSALSGRVRVSSSVTFAKQHIIPHLSLFLEENPTLEVDVVIVDNEIDYAKENIDVAFVWGAPAKSTLTVRKIGECRRVAVGTPAYFDRVGEPQSPDDLAAHQVMMLRQSGAGNVCTFRRGSIDTSVTVGSRFRVNAGEGLREAVLAGLGAAITSQWLFAPELARGDVIPVLTEWNLSPQTYWAVFPTGSLVDRKARAVADFVKSRIRKEAESEQDETVFDEAGVEEDA